MTVEADPRLLARSDGGVGRWRIGGGGYQVAVSTSAVTPRLTATVELASRTFGC